jgi:hypothetical protein
MHDITRTMHEAMSLMQRGDLRAATQAIQRGLQARSPADAPPRDADFIDALRGRPRIRERHCAADSRCADR